MKRFNYWLEEKKKKTRESMPTTPTSAPLRGANQDYSGVGVKHDNADYTISDEYVNEVVAGVGMIRSTPVNMKSTTNVKAKNAPSSAHAMQNAADVRRIQLDRQAQKLKDQLKRQRETEIARRKNANNL